MVIVLLVVVMKIDDVEENDVRGDDNSDDNDDNQLRKHQIGITQAKPFYLPLSRLQRGLNAMFKMLATRIV